MTDEEYSKLKQLVAKRVRLIQKHKEALNKLYESCPHTETFEKSYYFEGSYSDRASTQIDTKCSLCGKTLSTREKQHSWYG